MATKLVKLALFAAGAYVVASWVMAQKTKVRGALPAPAEPLEPPAPPEYPTDPYYCFEHPDDPLCADYVGI